MAEITAHHGLLKDTNLHVDDHGGAGRPVVLIHGWPLSGASWKDQVPALKAAGYRVVTYDRRGFGQSDKPRTPTSYTYDKLTEDLHAVLEELDLRDVTLVGFSMGGGEVARYVATYGEDRLHSVVFAGAVPPYLLQSDDNPDGPLTEDAAKQMRGGLEKDRDAFFDDFTTQFFSAGDDLKVSEEKRQEALAVCKLSDQDAALGCMDAFGGTDFRDDLTRITVPTLVIHGDSDGIVPFEGSGKRTHEIVDGSEVVVVEGAPHGFNASHAEEFNRALVAFLEK
jgi:non-heme chloroperoxidase